VSVKVVVLGAVPSVPVTGAVDRLVTGVFSR
jgi:hypothetical protein